MSREKFDEMLDTPPGSPSVGHRVLIGTSPTDAFAGKARQIATARSTTGDWLYTEPQTGDVFYDEETKLEYIFDGTNWVAVIAPWQAEGYDSSPGVTAPGASWFRYQHGGGSSSTVIGPAGSDIELRATMVLAYFETDTDVGTYTVTPYIETAAQEYDSRLNFVSAQGLRTRRGLQGSIVDPLIKVLGSDDSETWMRSGLKNDAGSVGDILSSTRAVNFYGYWCKVI